MNLGTFFQHMTNGISLGSLYALIAIFFGALSAGVTDALTV